MSKPQPFFANAIEDVLRETGARLSFDPDTEAFEFDGLLTLYTPDSPENESGAWEVWSTTYHNGSQWEPPGGDCELDDSHPNMWSALIAIASGLLQSRLNSQWDSYAMLELEDYSMNKSHAGHTQGGLEERFIIRRKDGEPIDPSRRYSLVLDFSGSDPHARVAARAYAASVRGVNRQLADDILEALENPADAPCQHESINTTKEESET